MVRPPTVERVNAVPSRGHRPPGRRSSIRSPWCEPPSTRRSSMVRRRCRWSRLTSGADSEPAGRRGDSPAPPQDFVGDQVPDAGHPRLVEQAGLERCPRPGQGRGEGGRADAGGVGAERRHLGIERDPAQPPGVTDHEGAAVFEADGEPVPAGLVAPRGIDQLVDAGPVVHDQRAGHPEPDPEGGAILDLEQQQLADAPSGNEPATHQSATEGGGVGSALDEPGVGSRHRGNPPVQRSSGQLSVALDLGKLGHPPRVPNPARRGTAVRGPPGGPR